MESGKFKIVYAITERGGKTFWSRIGIATVNRDGSLNVKLDALPVSGTMQVRDWTPKDEQTAAPAKRTNGGNEASMPLDDLPDTF